MLLLIHVTLALLGIMLATLALVIPTRNKIRASCSLAIATFASGTVLVWQTHASLVSACLSGLVYLSVVSVLITAASYRLVRVTQSSGK